jgi:RloB-like protein
MPNNRSYKKGAPHRDSRLFIIVAEGEREDAYFQYFHLKNQRIRISIVPREQNASAPKHFLNRLDKFEKEGLWSPKDDDALWFVLDVDAWKREHIDELITACEKDKNWNIAISNPSFEVWLLFHLMNNLEGLSPNLKNELHLKTSGVGYSPEIFCPEIDLAIQNAKQSDTTPSYIFPTAKQTKVYLLAEQLIEKLGINWRIKIR